jgi:hypothetical protein
LNTEPLVVPPCQDSGTCGAGSPDPVSAPAIHPTVTAIEPGVTPVSIETVLIPPHFCAITPKLPVGSAPLPIGAQFTPALGELPAALTDLPLIATELRVPVTPTGAGRRRSRSRWRRWGRCGGRSVLGLDLGRGQDEGQQRQEGGANGLHTFLECRCRS